MTGAVLTFGGRIDAAFALYETRPGNKLWGASVSAMQEWVTHNLPNGQVIMMPTDPLEEFFKEFRAKMPNGLEPPRASFWAY